MPFAILFLFPIIEIGLTFGFISKFGFMNVFFAWLLLTILGIGLLRTTGVRLSVSVAQSIRAGKSPGLAALEAACVGIAGLLFLLPGFASDAIAVILCIPPLRRYIARRLIAKVQLRTAGFSAARPNSGNDIIDVEAVEVPIRHLHEGSAESVDPRKE